MSKKEVDIFYISELDNPELNAIKACWFGEASAEQQRRAMNTIIDKLSMADFLPYQPKSFDETAFLNGRIFVGKAIRRILKLKQKE